MYICSDCQHEEKEYDAIAAHVRSLHNRKPLCKAVKAGSIVVHESVKCKVLKVYADGRLKVIPLRPEIAITLEYRVADSEWEFAK